MMGHNLSSYTIFLEQQLEAVRNQNEVVRRNQQRAEEHLAQMIFEVEGLPEEKRKAPERLLHDLRVAFCYVTGTAVGGMHFNQQLADAQKKMGLIPKAKP